jgi:hypothetical protein
MAKHYPAQVLRTAISAFALMGALFSSVANAQQTHTLPSYNAIYETTIKGFTIDGYRSLRRDENGVYHLNMKAKALLMTLSEDSYFTLTNSGELMPHSYKYLLKKPIVRNKEQSITFDWNNMLVNGKNKKTWQVPLMRGMSDRLNVLTALRLHLLHNGHADYQANIVDRGEIKSYTVSFHANERVQTPLGAIDTILMARDDSDRKSFFWLAPAWNYQLIRFVQEETDGERYELNIKHIEFAPGEEPSALNMASTEA